MTKALLYLFLNLCNWLLPNKSRIYNYFPVLSISCEVPQQVLYCMQNYAACLRVDLSLDSLRKRAQTQVKNGK